MRDGIIRNRSRPSLFDHLTASFDIDGIPNVDGLTTDHIDQQGRTYMERHYLLGQPVTGGSTVRYHHILQSDTRDMHDHPWDFISIILDGTYTETTPDAEQSYGPGSVLVRKAEQLHRLTLTDGPVWTLVILGQPRRPWGYQTSDGWIPWAQHNEPCPSREW